MQRVVSKDNPIRNSHNRMRGLVLSTQITKTLIGQSRNVLFVYDAQIQFTPKTCKRSLIFFLKYLEAE